MKHYTLILIGLTLFGLRTQAQDTQPQFLTLPADWRSEVLNFPLDFAPDLEYQGLEELRFAPGMFDTTATDYFTYMFVMVLEGSHDFTIPETKKFIASYFRGLSSAVGQGKEISVDTSLITVTVMRPDIKTGKHEGYFITVNFIDTFSGGRLVTLNMESVVLYQKDGQKTYIQALISPQPKYSATWKELYQYRKTLMNENPVFVNLRGK